MSFGNKKERDHSVDAAKGILIIMVVIGHIGYNNVTNAVAELIYLIHMPLFFFYGVFFSKPFSLSLLKEKAIRLLLPFGVMFALTPQVAHHVFKAPIEGLIHGGIALKSIAILTLFYSSLTAGIILRFNLSTAFSPTLLLRNTLFRYTKYGILIGWGILILVSVYLMGVDRMLNLVVFANFDKVRTVLWFLPALFGITIGTSLLLKLPGKVALPFSWLVVVTNPFLVAYLQPFHTIIPWGLDVALLMVPFCYCLKWCANQLSDWKARINPVTLLGLGLLLWELAYLMIKPVSVNGYDHRLDMAQLNLPWLPIVLLPCLGFVLVVSRYQRESLLSRLGQLTMPIFTLHMAVVETVSLANQYLDWPLHVNYAFQLILGVVIPVGISYCLKPLSLWFEKVGLA